MPDTPSGGDTAAVSIKNLLSGPPNSGAFWVLFFLNVIVAFISMSIKEQTAALPTPNLLLSVVLRIAVLLPGEVLMMCWCGGEMMRALSALDVFGNGPLFQGLMNVVGAAAILVGGSFVELMLLFNVVVTFQGLKIHVPLLFKRCMGVSPRSKMGEEEMDDLENRGTQEPSESEESDASFLRHPPKDESDTSAAESQREDGPNKESM